MALEPELVKIAFVGDDGGVETLWAFDIGNGSYKLDSTPWFQYGVSYQDVVKAEITSDGPLTFTGVVQKSGNRTLRVVLDTNATKEFTDSIIALGCSFEGANPKFLAIDVPPEVALDTVVSYLSDRGVNWEYGDPTYEQITSKPYDT
jgi:hypothetical protein